MKSTISFITIILFSVFPFGNLKTIYPNLKVNDTIPQVLYQMLPKLNDYAKIDTVFYPYDSIQEEDTSHVMAIGRFIDKKEIYAIDTSVKDSIISFYKYDSLTWKLIGKEKIPDFTWFRFKDLDGDGRNEILAESFPNMNGNVDYNIYYASTNKDQIHYAGNFFGRYELQLNKQLHYIYEGSWYADYIQALYEWRNEKLIPLKQVTIKLKNADSKHNAEWIIYEENPTFDEEILVCKFKKTYRKNNKKLYNLREHFFDNKF
ncbi:MAG: hypothetical protein V4548_09235 [Bacteroidota bacterium]